MASIAGWGTGVVLARNHAMILMLAAWPMTTALTNSVFFPNPFYTSNLFVFPHCLVYVIEFSSACVYVF